MNISKKKIGWVYEAGFRMYGYGHFDVSAEEFEQILQILHVGSEADLKSFYKRLHAKRMG